MSQENVELQHQVIDAINRRDFGLVLDSMDADVEAGVPTSPTQKPSNPLGWPSGRDTAGDGERNSHGGGLGP